MPTELRDTQRVCVCVCGGKKDTEEMNDNLVRQVGGFSTLFAAHRYLEFVLGT